MPKLYEYLGISVFFFASEHLPVRVHGRYGDLERKLKLLRGKEKLFPYVFAASQTADRWTPRRENISSNSSM